MTLREIVSLAAAVFIVYCVINLIVSIVTPDLTNTDAKQGWVEVRDNDGETTGFQKMCDGSTLIYKSNDLLTRAPSSVANSPECS